ncbi:SCO family protein [Alcanivorax sp. IL2]|uniref:SCO family protein n=1 Tax=Alcanivorax sp. IL2 TaxID=3396310 RepID=UPI0039C1834A
MSPRTKNIATLSAIVAPFVLFFLAGRFLIDPWELPRENKGQLLIPHIDMATLKAVNDDGDAYTGDDMTGLWTILYVAGSECDTRCKNGLYYQMRQVRQTLGADVDRVRRVILHTAPAGDSLNEFLNNNVKGMVSIYAEPQTVNNALAPVHETTAGEPIGDIFLVSPDGQIFMRYPTHENMDATLEEAENIRVDLKRTLKGSLIG